MLRAVEQPQRKILYNCGEEASVVVNKVLNDKGNYGYNAQSDEYGDMMEMGVLAPPR